MYNRILIDSEEITDIKDLEFLTSKSLLLPLENGKYKVNFIGEVLTPNINIISIPKDFKSTEENANLIVSLLKTFKNLKKDGKYLIENKSFTTNGEIESDIHHFRSLKKFFTDSITYDFISPKKKLRKHTNTPMAEPFDVVETEINVSRVGSGLTYKIKDKSNKNWKVKSLSDIYYTTLYNLMNQFGTDSDKIEFKSITEYYRLNGHVFNMTNIDDDVAKQIEINDVSPIHLPIKLNLLNYYKSRKVKEKWKIRVFYSYNLDYIWRFFCKMIMHHNDNFKQLVNWVDVKVNNEIIDIKPDIFSDLDIRFIADCNYSNTFDDIPKKWYEYNTCQDNKYPMIILSPGDVTELVELRIHRDFELLLVSVSLSDVLDDAINGGRKTIDNIFDIIKSNSKRV